MSDHAAGSRSTDTPSHDERASTPEPGSSEAGAGILLLADPAPRAALEARLADPRLLPVQRQQLARSIAQVAGNQQLSRMVAAVQRDGEAPPGRGISTAFGTYWIVPDGTNQSYNVEGEQVTESEFAEIERAWNDLNAGTGNVKVVERDDSGNNHAGFRSGVLAQLGKLMSGPQGRGLLMGLIRGSREVTIAPTARRSVAYANRGAGSLETAAGESGGGGTTRICIDPDLRDDSVVAYDRAGNEVASPVFLVLGHELIHAQHNAAGRNRRERAPSEAAFGNLEEEQTISTGTGVTENRLRAEHGIGARFGHGARDTRPAP